jgi:hypothetical protein
MWDAERGMMDNEVGRRRFEIFFRSAIRTR